MGQPKMKGGLGFRELESFNLAMLAKQGWRLLTNPESMVAQIMKAKYYPQHSFLEANLGTRPSFAWRSIWNSRTLLKEGLIWRVGNGESIKIWQDRWLPSPSSYLVQAPIQGLSAEAKVCELIDNDTRWWNTPLIQDIFPPEVAAKICSLALSPSGHQDKLVWRGTANGVFTVRSAYHLARETLSSSQGECSKVSSHVRLWKKLWKLNLPMSARQFLWRACTNSLPTKENLFRRKITSDPLCPFCGLYTESTGHILWSCESAMAVWMEGGRQIQKLVIAESDGLELFEKLSDALEDDVLELVVVLARKIWLRRNSFVFSGVLSSPQQLVKAAKDSLSDFQNAALSSNMGPAGIPNTVGQQWRKPPVGVVKINWDAGVAKATSKMGVGVIARDSTGQVLASMCTTMPFITDPTVAEAVAAWRAVQFCIEHDFQDIFLEGDALEIVQALHQDTPNRSRYGQLIEDTRDCLNSRHSWVVSHIRRGANEAAHRLAQAALHQSLDQSWLGCYPPFIHNIVLSEKVC
jgi:ribonuclease HI